MLISKLFSGIEYEIKGEDVDILSLQKHSQQKSQNGIFFCYRGVNKNGEDYAVEAIQNGAIAIVVEEFSTYNVTQIKVDNVRKIIAKVCSNFFGNPEKDMKIIGITGTNGKTTTSYMLKNILETADKKVGLIGTNGIEINKVFFRATLTTPDPQELFEVFQKMKNADVEFVVMEVSAHALDLYKVWGIKFEVGVFTNFTRDHLDYFGSMEKYKQTKKNFFCQDYCKKCVFNVDDETGREFFNCCDVPKCTYGIINPSDAFAVSIDMKLSGSKFVVNCFDDIFNIEISCAGKFNVYNALSAIITAKLLGINSEHIVAGLYTLENVAGRFNLLSVGTKSVVIDFAHTPDGMENVLRTAKALSKGYITTVFGCGGNRDKGKRKVMGEIANKYSDKVIITSDNPRFENPYSIIDEIKQGCPNGLVIENRTQAIITAVTTSPENSCILVLGKGAEDYQEIDGIKHHFSDFEVVKQLQSKQKYKKE